MAGKRNQNGRKANGPYKFTAKRKVALKRAQAKSARKRRANIKAGVITGATLAGIGAVAVFGYKNRSSISATGTKWKAAVQPGSKERVRLANALGGNRVKEPPKTEREWRRTELGKVNPNDPSQFHPHDKNAVETRNEAFPKTGAAIREGERRMAGSDRPYNLDKFLPKGIKKLIWGKKVTGLEAGKAASAFAANARAQGMDIDASAVLHDMIADGKASGVYEGKKARKGRKNRGGADPIRPKNSRAGRMSRAQAKANLESKAFDQWIKDFEPEG